MKYSVFVFAILFPICTIIFLNLNEKLKKRASPKSKRNNFVVYLPEIYAIVGFMDALIFGVFILLSPILWPSEKNNNIIIFYIIFTFFLFLGIYIIIKTTKFKVVVQEKKITVFPIFSKSYCFYFDDINMVIRQTKERNKGKAERIIVYTNLQKKIVVDNSFVSYKKMIESIKENVEPSKLTGFDEICTGDGSLSSDNSNN